MKIDITIFSDSPDSGHPECLCSFCKKQINSVPSRLFLDDGREMRFHTEVCLPRFIELDKKNRVNYITPESLVKK